MIHSPDATAFPELIHSPAAIAFPEMIHSPDWIAPDVIGTPEEDYSPFLREGTPGAEPEKK